MSEDSDEQNFQEPESPVKSFDPSLKISNFSGQNELSLQEQLSKIQEELAKKENKVSRLKSLLTRSMRNDKRNQQQIETLQFDLADRDRHVSALNKELEEQQAFSSKQSERITQLEQELKDLTERLQNGSGSETAQKKIDRLKQMLDRSQTLYAELQTKYQQTYQDLTEEKNKHRAVPIPTSVLILSDDEAITLNENNTFSIGNPQDHYPESVNVRRLRSIRGRSSSNEYLSQTSQKNNEGSQNLLKIYLKKVLLEFFVGDASTQLKLIPVILNLLECNQEQILAAQRSYAEGRQIISKAAAVLGL